MSLDTILLHVLIVLSPTIIVSLFYDRSKISVSPYFIGGLNSVAAVLCVIYPYMAYETDWDLRYLPFVVTCLYGGPYAAAFVWLSIGTAQIFLGSETLAFDHGSGFVIATLPLAISCLIRNRRDYKFRRKAIVMIALWIGLVKSVSLYVYTQIEDIPLSVYAEESQKLLLVSLIYGIVYSVVFLMNEGMIERRRMKLEIARSEKLNALGEIAASIAHEIRNPLTVVKGFLQLMKQREKGESSQYLPLILAELARAETILNEYLSYAKPHLVTTERVQVSTIIENIVVLLEPLSIIQGVQLESRLSVNPAVSGDRNQLQQALLNITKNGIEATPAGGKVTIHLTHDDDWVYIKITDTGRGMSKEHLDRLGTLFYSTKDKGTGLGTTVSWQIIRNMNGTIHYESQLNVGTEAIIKLPLAK